MSSKDSPAVKSLHEFTVKDSRGEDVDLNIYKDKVLLIVNVASQCGLTNSNYTEMSQLYEKYKDKDSASRHSKARQLLGRASAAPLLHRASSATPPSQLILGGSFLLDIFLLASSYFNANGLEILAFPCNQFGGQEPGSNEEIVEFACTRFKAEYPIFDKVDVNGESAAPIYRFLKSSKGGIFGDGIKWNFTKFLVDKKGNVVDRYAPTTSPLSIEKDIKKLLGAS